MIPERKRAVFNWSGGKDSALALLKALQSGEYDILLLLTTVNSATDRSSMHAIPVELLQEQADSIGIPLYPVYLSPDGGLSEYGETMRQAMDLIKKKNITHSIFGDIFLEEIRNYRIQQLTPYGIEVVEPLWNKTTEEIMDEFLMSGLKTVIVTTLADQLDQSYIGQLINRPLIKSLPEGVDPCGENGEYHTFCYDGPIFRYPIRFSLGEPILFSHEVTREDGDKQTFSYWFANLETEPGR